MMAIALVADEATARGLAGEAPREDADPARTVREVLIPPEGMDEAEAIAWCKARIGDGPWEWVPTYDDRPPQQRANVGMTYDPADPRVFFVPDPVPEPEPPPPSGGTPIEPI